MSGVFLGWDIGGAHLKVAKIDQAGSLVAVRQIACPLWRGVNELSRAMALIDFAIDEPDAVHAVTMTGELCDIFPDRISGVREIINQFQLKIGGTSNVRVFAGYEGWVDAAAAAANAAAAVASANWLALAAFTAETIGDGVLIDIGSTTTDIVPIIGGEVQAHGRDDGSRMAAGELLYTGVVRTPVNTVCQQVPFRGRWQPLAAETFATMADVYRLLGRIGESDDLMPSADGRSKDLAGSAFRLARMLGHDQGDEEMGEIVRVARFLAQSQRARLEQSLDLVLSREPFERHGDTLIGAGVGRFLIADIAQERNCTYRSFDALIDSPSESAAAASVAAPAVAAAKLAWMTA